MESEDYKHDVMKLFSDKKLVKICAPMVRYSKLQFRSLVREYNCDLCFTPMLLADSFCQSEKARYNEYSTNLADSPVIVQYAANTVHDFVGAAYMVSPYCSGVDLNCGCPQRWAKTQGIGCIMLEKPETIYNIVRQCRNHISKPFSVSVKMRILSDMKKTVAICQQLEHCGVSFVTVHARTANQHSVGPVNVEALKLISESLSCPVIANGGVKTLKEAEEIQENSNCKGVMAASALLTNPALFSGVNITPLDCVQKWVDICFNNTLDFDSFSNVTRNKNVIHEFQKRNENLTFQCFHHHLVFMLEKVLPKYLRKIFNNLQTFESVLKFLDDEFSIRPNIYPLDKFNLYDRLTLCYENRTEKYLQLKKCNDSIKFDFNVKYNSDITEGKYFSSKKSVDDCDTCISSLFIDD